MVTSADVARHIHYANANFFGVTASTSREAAANGVPVFPKNTPIVYIPVSVSELSKKSAVTFASLNRKKIKPIYATSEATANRLRDKYDVDRYITQAELTIDRLLANNCTACNPSVRSLSVSPDAVTAYTTSLGDQPLIKQSCRMIPLNDGETVTVVIQPGTYYRGVDFIPSKQGKKVSWFSSQNNGLRHLSARLCCILNAINSFKNESSGVIRDFQMLTFPEPNTTSGPLETKCIKQDDIDSFDFMLICIVLVQ